MTTQSLQPMAHAPPSNAILFAGDISQWNDCRCFPHTENLRNTSVQQNDAKPLYDPKLWSYKEREREREIKTLGPHCHAISSHRDSTTQRSTSLFCFPALSLDHDCSWRTSRCAISHVQPADVGPCRGGDHVVDSAPSSNTSWRHYVEYLCSSLTCRERAIFADVGSYA